MYERYFQLRERPFALSPDPEYLYPSKVHQEALSYLRYGIEGHAGFVVITGEIGSGKTTMLQSLLGRLDRNTSVARIVNTMLDPRELLDAIMLDFGMDPTGLSKPVLLHRLAEFLVAERQANHLVLLVIDEAQNLSLAALEEIRMLSNLETEKSKLIQIIMIGQPELREKLALPQLQQLRQRITVSYHLQPLDLDETSAYVNHRLRRAALGPAVEFPRDVADLIHTRSRGVPRIINVIADATLLFAYGVDRRNVDVGIAQDALAELDATGVLASYHSEGAEAAAAARSMAEAQEATRMAEDIRTREHALAVRERQLALREQQIAAQQRVVEEEARILAAARTRSANAAAHGAGTHAVGANLDVGAGAHVAGAETHAVGAGTPAVSADTHAVGAVTHAVGADADVVGAGVRAVGAGAGTVNASGSRPTSSPVASTSHTVAPASSAVAPTPRSGAAATSTATAPAARSGIAPTGAAITPPVRSGSVPGNSPAAPTMRTGVAPTSKVFAPRHTGISVTPSGVRVQRYTHTEPSREAGGFWERVRRILFGITEPERGA